MLSKITIRVGLLLGLGLLFAASQCPAGSIFDDDYVPPQRAETPKADVPAPTPEPTPTPTPPTIVNPTEVPAIPAPTSTANETRRAVPKPAEQAQCRKLFKEAFADQLKDKSPGGRGKLAGALLIEAAKTTATPIDYFVLLSGAVQSGEEAGSLHLSFDAIDTLSKSYTFDPLAAKADAVENVWVNVTPATATAGNVQNAIDVVDALVTDDDFATAAKVEAALQKSMGRIRDAELKSLAANFVRDFETARIEREKLKSSLGILKKSPADPAANLAVGSFWCFTAGRWEKGLPFLARGNDAAIKNLAETELLQAANAEAVAKVADGWWNAAAKFTGGARTRTQIHAAGLYRAVADKLPGLRRLSAENRIAGAPSSVSPRWIDLLDLVHPSVDAVVGTWQMENGMLVCPSAPRGQNNRVEFTYSPPEEYDFRIVFTLTKGHDCVVQLCSGAGHQFEWICGGWDNTVAGFETVQDRRADNNVTTKRAKRWLVEGQKCVSVVKVRKSGIEAFVNGQPVSGLKTDYSDLSTLEEWRLRRDGTIGVGTWEDTVQFESIEVIELSGRGHNLR